MSELSHFEELSAQTPKKGPYAIIIGTVLLPILLWAINLMAPSEGVKDLKDKEKESKDTPAATAGPSSEDIEDI